jgi:hypothetical protein
MVSILARMVKKDGSPVKTAREPTTSPGKATNNNVWKKKQKNLRLPISKISFILFVCFTALFTMIIVGFLTSSCKYLTKSS